MRTQSYYPIQTITRFVAESPESVLGTVLARSGFDVAQEQRDAWVSEIELLRVALDGIPGSIALEYVVPRIGSRIDAVLISGAAIVVIEFKVGSATFDRGAIEQVWDYALDLKNFHEASHHAAIFPILVATEGRESDSAFETPFSDEVYPPARCNVAGLRRLVEDAVAKARGAVVDAEVWQASRYRPTPTIIEAAQALYRDHSVEAIARHDAGAKNLVTTSARVEQIARNTQLKGEKAIVFVTGVPGAGKTLVGLNIATKRGEDAGDQHAVFLSGNGPLVAVLREALAMDHLERELASGVAMRKGEARQKVQVFIQNIHHFRDDGLRSHHAPDVRIVIFDEAQRAWNLAKTVDFMRRKKGQPDFAQSESAYLISYLDRHVDWAVIVCLVGGGQEIHDGEAGISAWLDAAREQFPSWRIFVSPNLVESEYAAEAALDRLAHHPGVVHDEDLHLATSMRSFRAERLSHFVRAMLDIDRGAARRLASELAERYPMAVTRDLSTAKQWIKQHARGSERFGLVASSSAFRLKPHAIDIRVKVDPVHWFLKGRDDTRSSWYLEDAATEFQVQGLELDWTCVTWDGDLRFDDGEWSFKEFKGTSWNFVRKSERQRYLLNAYRVLLTRARQGMVIFVPPGDPEDQTRLPSFYNETFDYLTGLGLPVLVS